MKEKFVKQGADAFLDHQLLEMLLFYAYPRRDTNEIAHKMINEYGNFHNLFEADPMDISRRCNVTINVATIISLTLAIAKRYTYNRWEKPKEIISNPKKAAELAISLFIGAKVEQLYMICLNVQKQLIHTAKLVEGDLSEIYLYPRLFVETALKFQAVNVIITHNHPGGTLSPSRGDIEGTRELIAALRTIRVEVIDHIIVAGNCYYSFMEKKMLPW